MLSADVVTLHCESKERHLQVVRMTSKPHGRHLHVGMQGIGTTRAKHRNNSCKASERPVQGTPPDSGGEKVTLSAEGNQLAGTLESLIDVRTDILFAEEFVEVRLVEHSLDSGIDT